MINLGPEHKFSPRLATGVWQGGALGLGEAEGELSLAPSAMAQLMRPREAPAGGARWNVSMMAKRRECQQHWLLEPTNKNPSYHALTGQSRRPLT